MIITSYFGNLYLNHFKKDCREIKRHGFDTILFCVTENDIYWNIDNIRAMKEYAESQDLKTMAGPWGLANVFGGEAVSTVDYKRDGLEQVLALFDRWMESILNIGFDTVFLDEPHASNETLKFTTSIYKKYKELVDFYVCFCDVTFNRLTNEDLINLPIKNIGLSAYFWTNDDAKIKSTLHTWITRLLKLRPEDNHIWLQGFDLPAGREHVPVLVYNIARDLGIKNFGFWAYKSAEATSAKRAINYKFVWKQMYNLFSKTAEEIALQYPIDQLYSKNEKLTNPANF